jgi:large subunit ribosomal protein L14
MIEIGSSLKVLDNGGVMAVKCLRILGPGGKELAGEKVKVSIKKVKPLKKVKQGNKLQALIAGSGRLYYRRDGSSIRFGRGSIIMLDKRGRPLGKKVRGPVLKEFKKKQSIRTLAVTIKTV